MELSAWQFKISTWAEKTFKHNERGIALHTVREVVELAIACGVSDEDIRASVEKELAERDRNAKFVGEELADILILTLTMADYCGEELETCLAAKYVVNTARKWGKPDEQGITEHVEEVTA